MYQNISSFSNRPYIVGTCENFHIENTVLSGTNNVVFEEKLWISWNLLPGALWAMETVLNGGSKDSLSHIHNTG